MGAEATDRPDWLAAALGGLAAGTGGGGRRGSVEPDEGDDTARSGIDADGGPDAPADGLSRRDFVKVTGVAGAGLVLAVSVPGCGPAERGEDGAMADGADVEPIFAPNAWIRVDAEGDVTVVVDRSEMGQGVASALPTLVAEELEVPLERVAFEFAPAGQEYVNPAFGIQGTGGSTSVRMAWEPMRKAGAAARAMLVAAAAGRWGVDAGACRAEAGEVIHEASGRRAGYGELTGDAAELEVPEDPALKDPADFRLLGQPRRRLDTPPKVDGTATFGIDVRPDGVLIGRVARCPVFGGTVAELDDASARQVPGVRNVVDLGDRVGVVADHYWAAQKGLEALDVTWDEGEWADQDDEAIAEEFRRIARRPGVEARSDGDPDGALSGAARTVEAAYDFPYLAHATMEPMNATAHVRSDGCELWAPTQNQSGCLQAAAEIAGVDEEDVTVHTTYLGGGFGRRFELDFVRDALELSKAAGAPVKAVWSREDDTRHDFYRPASHHVLRAALDGDGRPTAWTHRLVVPSIMKRAFPGAVQDGLDTEAVEGAVGMPYAMSNVRVDYHDADVGVPVGFWRSVNHTHNGFVVETFMDELARTAGRDPVDYRRELLSDAPHHLRVLERAAEAAGWGSSLPEGRARGVAVVESFGSHVAEVAEVSLEDGRPRVHRVMCAVDCGPMVNPSIVEAQMESGIVYGLTAALYGEINIEDGRARQGNFDDYRMLRLDEMPEVEVVHVTDGQESVGGVGEPGTPPIAPAVANAVRELTGEPVRRLPIRV
jgi:isoquinoline 1-oxidoreductase beta subunit